jgi:hypothetical protein
MRAQTWRCRPADIGTGPQQLLVERSVGAVVPVQERRSIHKSGIVVRGGQWYVVWPEGQRGRGRE